VGRLSTLVGGGTKGLVGRGRWLLIFTVRADDDTSSIGEFQIATTEGKKLGESGGDESLR